MRLDDTGEQTSSSLSTVVGEALAALTSRSTPHVTRRAPRRRIAIKINIAGNVDDALAALGHPVEDSSRRVWFLEGRDGVDEGRLDMLSRNVVLRIGTGTDGDESAAKLRPVSPGRLVDEWAKPFTKSWASYRIEGSWSGTRRFVASSAESSHPRGTVATALEAADFTPLLTPTQRKLVRDCIGVDLAKRPLTSLGPIASTTWLDVRIGEIPGVDAERWTVEGLDYLTLRTRVQSEDTETDLHFQQRAERLESQLSDAVEAVGLRISTGNDSKTGRVLAALLAAR